MNSNIGFLTGTHVGTNNSIHSKVSLSQVRKDFADPKAAPKEPRGNKKLKNSGATNKTNSNSNFQTTDGRRNESQQALQTATPLQMFAGTAKGFNKSKVSKLDYMS